ncbi:hypothetical protein ACFIQG_20440 [Comamonas odontotermitis]|uniref:hypothetical protein n=1 Tax=Comamonas odontotermitis TaxID=379895 RepID=UPI003670225C
MTMWKTDKFIVQGEEKYQHSKEMGSNARAVTGYRLDSLYCLSCEKLERDFDQHPAIGCITVECPNCGASDQINAQNIVED